MESKKGKEDNTYIDFLLKLKKIADDMHYSSDAENNCEMISEMIDEELNRRTK